jgi:hypothetical protein
MPDDDQEFPEGHEHPEGEQEKHLQLGTDLDADDRTPLDPDGRDAAWADATTVEQFAEDIETLRAAGWPVGS